MSRVTYILKSIFYISDRTGNFPCKGLYSGFSKLGKTIRLVILIISFSNNIFCSHSVSTVTTKESESYAIQQASKPPGTLLTQNGNKLLRK